jgi:hypothetical protein
VNESFLDVARNVLVGAGLVVALWCLARGLPARVAIGAGLEFWIAGGLLKLSAAIISWEAIATVVIIITLRKVVVMAFPRPPPLPRRPDYDPSL